MVTHGFAEGSRFKSPYRGAGHGPRHRIKAPYLVSHIDRHGRLRFHVRKNGKWTLIRSEPNSPQFWADYAAILKGEQPPHSPAPEPRVTLPKRSGGEPGVYFVRGDRSGLVKIGYSVNPRKRMKGLMTGAAEPLTLLFVIRAPRSRERALHARFAKYRTQGEWFEAGPDLAAFIAKRSQHGRSPDPA